MRNTLYAVLATCLAMLATSGVVALATAAPEQASAHQQVRAEEELRILLDDAIGQQLLVVHARLDRQRPTSSRAQ